MSKRGLFITGTDTGVGKTHCAAALVRELRDRGMDVGVMKPVETGCRSRRRALVPSDALMLLEAAGACDGLSVVNPYRFSRPLAPSIAARLDVRTIRKEVILRSYRQLLKKHAYLVVEGAGGILVPIDQRYTFRDLAYEMKLSVLIVARPGLGTINHTLLTVEALKKRSIPIVGIVINYAGPSRRGLAERTGPQEIESISDVPVLGTVRYGSDDVKRIVDRILSPCTSRGRGRGSTSR